MEEKKKVYKKICNRKLAIPLVILIIIVCTILVLTQKSTENIAFKLIPFYGIVVLAVNFIEIKKENKKLEELGGISVEEKSEVDMSLKKYRKNVIVSAFTAFVVITVIYSIFMLKENRNGSDTNTCGSCGISYQAGDADGNYMSIAKSGLCKNCNSNREYFEWIFD